MRRLVLSAATIAALGLGAGQVSAQSEQAEGEQPAGPTPEEIARQEAEQRQMLNTVFEEAREINQVAQASQQRIDDLSNETSQLLQQYRSLLKEIQGLRAYNAQQQRVIDNQEQERSNLQDSIDRVVEIRRQITPLMLRMIDTLEQFVELDVPFLLEERRERVDFLRELMDASDVSPSEKFRRVLEAYQIEVDFGRTIEAYTGTIDADGRELEVNFLRVGRVVLAYQTRDKTINGFWNSDSKSFEPLPDSYANSIAEGIQIANQQTSPNLVRLPISGPEQVQ